MDNEMLNKILTKLDNIETEVRNFYEIIAKNEAEHKNLEQRIEYLYKYAEKKESEGIKAIAWIASITGIMLTIINILDKIFRGVK